MKSAAKERGAVGETEHYTRIVNIEAEDGAGQRAAVGCRFEDAEFPLSGQRITQGMPEMAVGALPAVTGAAYVRSGSFDSAPHPAPRRQWVVMLRGTIEVVVTDGSRRVFGPGDLLLAEDVGGLGHITSGIDEGPFEALMLPAP
jgi:hypothetical protein